MKESDLNKRTMDHVAKVCQPSVYYKLADGFSKGLPDSVFTYSGHTSWLEFKHLDPNECIHDQLKPLQLTEAYRLERACGRAWVVAFRRANVKRLILPSTVIYRPSALLHGVVPIAREFSVVDNVLRDLNIYGVAMFTGHCYDAVRVLIQRTHEGY